MTEPEGKPAQPNAQFRAVVIAVNISPGGIPKHAVDSAEVTPDGLVGDGHDHDKHSKPHRAVLIQDVELLDAIRADGFDVGPGAMGENLTVRGLDVQRRSPGDRIEFQDGPVLELTEPRKSCYVLDAIDPALKEAVKGRCGFLASVKRTGRLYPGQHITVVPG